MSATDYPSSESALTSHNSSVVSSAENNPFSFHSQNQYLRRNLPLLKELRKISHEVEDDGARVGD
ncbi:hypothetical protein TSUD_332280 [Trifolium subterraneum]|uniref:Uncharacterized protein n=1 Tax=Trifolium subterraneum TaxID=3900 RepID=A0A2Z6NEA4_TRISU|nr:hypothetical protein TSUD_332280 [Trifolium subterraneum]